MLSRTPQYATLPSLVVIFVSAMACGSTDDTSPPAADSSIGETTDSFAESTVPDTTLDDADASPPNDVSKDQDDASKDDAKDDATDATKEAGKGDAGDAAEGGSGDASGLACGSATCATGEVCCGTSGDAGATLTCAKKCSGGITIACDGPLGCTPSAKYCCATIDGTGSTLPPPDCFKSGGASCKAACPTTISFTCDKSQVKLCRKGADCAGDPVNSNCCDFSTGTLSARFCADDTTKGFAIACY
ncbi:MAG: hypothetical protein NVSMB1_16450 [Polyangiales bacterium]